MPLIILSTCLDITLLRIKDRTFKTLKGYLLQIFLNTAMGLPVELAGLLISVVADLVTAKSVVNRTLIFTTNPWLRSRLSSPSNHGSKSNLERAHVDGDRIDDHPRIYKKLFVECVIGGVDLDPKAVERSVQLSVEKYCSVQAMLKASVPVEHTITIL